jgi:nucleoid-associated protein YgaU
MALKDMYAYAVKVSQGKFKGTIQEKDGKLHFDGTVGTQDDKNEIWNAIKTIPTWQKEIAADIRVTGTAAPAAPAAPAAAAAAKTYTVKAGDTLGKIAQEHLGKASDYMRIFEVNKDQLTNPDLIKPGQVLRIP